MVDLMEHQPEAVLVPYHVPPIEEERSDKPTHEPFQRWHLPIGQVEHRYVEDSDPGPRRDESDAELSGVDEQGAEIPATRLGKVASGVKPLDDEKHRCRDYHENAGKSHQPLCWLQPAKDVATTMRKASCFRPFVARVAASQLETAERSHRP